MTGQEAITMFDLAKPNKIRCCCINKQCHDIVIRWCDSHSLQGDRAKQVGPPA